MDFDEIEDCMPEGGHTDNEGNMVSSAQWLHDFAKNVAAHEREACAKVSEVMANTGGVGGWSIASAIRARSNAPKLTGRGTGPERNEDVWIYHRRSRKRA